MLWLWLNPDPLTCHQRQRPDDSGVSQMWDNNVLSVDTHCRQEWERGNGQKHALWRQGQNWRGRAVPQIILRWRNFMTNRSVSMRKWDLTVASRYKVKKQKNQRSTGTGSGHTASMCEFSDGKKNPKPIRDRRFKAMQKHMYIRPLN